MPIPGDLSGALAVTRALAALVVGLALSIVKHNAEMYGGTVQVQSELGKGATFIIQLPTRTFMKLQK